MEFNCGRRFDVIAMGRATCDMYSEQTCLLKDSRTFARYLGGSPANTAAAMSKLGLKVAFLGCVSDDGMGQFVRGALERFGIDASHLRTDHEGHRTAITIGEISGGGKCSSIFYRNSCADLFIRPEDADEEFIASSSALLVSGTSLSHNPARSAVFAAASRARKSGTKVIFDPDFREGTWDDAGDAAAFLAYGDMDVPEEEGVARIEAGVLLRRVEMTVGDEDLVPPGDEETVVGHDGKAQHGLVDLGVAVAAHAEDGDRKPREHGGDLFGRVVPGQVVARPVVERVAQEQERVGLFGLHALEEQAAVIRRAVDIGGNDGFHRKDLPKRLGSSEGTPSDFSPRKAKNKLNPFFPGTCASGKTLLALQVCERPPQASARSRVQFLLKFVKMP